jgi:DNA end-binding protein Ku
VGLYPATKDKSIHFNQFEEGTSDRIRYKKVNERTGEEVATADIVRGMDLGGGEYVIVTNEELKNVAPGRSETIEISDFVALDEIDPLYFQSSYYLAPRGKGADRAYSLLRQAMQETGKIGIATLVLRDKEHLVAVRPGDDALIVETMYFPAEIRTASEELETLPEVVTFEGREITVAKTLIESLAVEWEPDRYQNTYRDRIDELIESKRAGKAIVAKTSKPATNVVDLMAALEASVARTGDKAATPAKAATTARPRKVADQTPIPLAKLSKAKLAELAAEFDIAGRSSMSKDDLVSALNDAGAAEAAESKPKGRKAKSA